MKTKQELVNYGEANEALKQGKRIQKLGSKDFIFMQVPATINRVIVPKMQSLPQTVKDEFEKRFNDDKQQLHSIYYQNQLALVGSSNIITGWSPSTSDALSEDWVVLD